MARKIVSVSVNKENWEAFQKVARAADMPSSRLVDLILRDYMRREKESIVRVFQESLDSVIERKEPWVTGIEEEPKKRKRMKGK